MQVRKVKLSDSSSEDGSPSPKKEAAKSRSAPEKSMSLSLSFTSSDDDHTASAKSSEKKKKTQPKTEAAAMTTTTTTSTAAVTSVVATDPQPAPAGVARVLPFSGMETSVFGSGAQSVSVSGAAAATTSAAASTTVAADTAPATKTENAPPPGSSALANGLTAMLAARKQQLKSADDDCGNTTNNNNNNTNSNSKNPIEKTTTPTSTNESKTTKSLADAPPQAAALSSSLPPAATQPSKGAEGATSGASATTTPTVVKPLVFSFRKIKEESSSSSDDEGHRGKGEKNTNTAPVQAVKPSLASSSSSDEDGERDKGEARRPTAAPAQEPEPAIPTELPPAPVVPAATGTPAVTAAVPAVAHPAPTIHRVSFDFAHKTEPTPTPTPTTATAATTTAGRSSSSPPPVPVADTSSLPAEDGIALLAYNRVGETAEQNPYRIDAAAWSSPPPEGGAAAGRAEGDAADTVGAGRYPLRTDRLTSPADDSTARPSQPHSKGAAGGGNYNFYNISTKDVRATGVGTSLLPPSLSSGPVRASDTVVTAADATPTAAALALETSQTDSEPPGPQLVQPTSKIALQRALEQRVLQIPNDVLDDSAGVLDQPRSPPSLGSLLLQALPGSGRPSGSPTYGFLSGGCSQGRTWESSAIRDSGSSSSRNRDRERELSGGGTTTSYAVLDAPEPVLRLSGPMPALEEGDDGSGLRRGSTAPGAEAELFSAALQQQFLQRSCAARRSSSGAAVGGRGSIELRCQDSLLRRPCKESEEAEALRRRSGGAAAGTTLWGRVALPGFYTDPARGDEPVVTASTDGHLAREQPPQAGRGPGRRPPPPPSPPRNNEQPSYAGDLFRSTPLS